MSGSLLKAKSITPTQAARVLMEAVPVADDVLRIDPESKWLYPPEKDVFSSLLPSSWRERPEEAVAEPASQDVASDAWGEALGLLKQLSPQARALVWLHQVEGWTHDELGRRFGHSESWSKSIVSRALAQLRDHANPEIRDAD